MKKNIKKLNDFDWSVSDEKIKPISIEQFIDINGLTLFVEQQKGRLWVVWLDVIGGWCGYGNTQLQAISNLALNISGKILEPTNIMGKIKVPDLIVLGRKGYVNQKKRL